MQLHDQSLQSEWIRPERASSAETGESAGGRAFEVPRGRSCWSSLLVSVAAMMTPFSVSSGNEPSVEVVAF